MDDDTLQISFRSSRQIVAGMPGTSTVVDSYSGHDARVSGCWLNHN
jgi:hypothetical protein